MTTWSLCANHTVFLNLIACAALYNYGIVKAAYTLLTRPGVLPRLPIQLPHQYCFLLCREDSLKFIGTVAIYLRSKAKMILLLFPGIKIMYM